MPTMQTINPSTALYCGTCAEIVNLAMVLKIQMKEVEKSVRNMKTQFLEWLQKDTEMGNVL